MRSIPVDTSTAMAFVATAPEDKVKDRRTGEISVDMETKAPLKTLSVTFVLDGEASLIQLAVPAPGVPEDLTPGTVVALTGLVARPWEMENNGRKTHGISFRAVAVTSLAPAPARKG